MAQELNSDFIVELFKACLRSTSTMQICSKFLKPAYLPEEAERNVWVAMVNFFDLTNTLPSLGILGQEFGSKAKEKGVLQRVRNADIVTNEILLTTLEDFIKRTMTVQAYELVGDLYNKGKHDEALEIWDKVSRERQDFTIKSAQFEAVFGGHADRMQLRKAESILSGGLSQQKFPFSIDELDALTAGGMVAGDVACFLALSGVGKSKLLKWIGVGLARRGYRVLHIQLEGTKKECEDLYSATWSGQLLQNIEAGDLAPDVEKKLIKTANQIEGEIYVHCFEQFDTASMLDVDLLINDVTKAHGPIHAVIMDYLELADPGDGKKYGPAFERERRLAVANKAKNIAVKWDIPFVTATQASDVTQEWQNKPENYLTRSHISDIKGLIKPFSFFITLNQTEDEYEQGIMRLYCDKFRKYKGKKMIYICQRFDRERFYDRKKTLANYYSAPKGDILDVED